MKAYFDHPTLGNLSGVDDLAFDTQHRDPLLEAGFTLESSEIINEQGIYIVSVRNHVDWWSGKNFGGPTRHVLYEIPLHILDAARKKKVVIVIDQQAEGFTLNEMANVDGFKELHDTMHNLQLPKNSVLLVDGNFQFDNEYTTWCIYNHTFPKIAQVPFFTHTYYFTGTMPIRPLAEEAIKNLTAKSFNSLNRTVRVHRIAHLFYIVHKGWEKHGLVSGHWTNDSSNPNKSFPPLYFINVPERVFRRFLEVKLPLSVDGDFASNTNLTPDTDLNTIFNHNIYKNSLLSVVTETSFHRSGMFYTEKVFKPIAAGHPLMVLGQYRLLDHLESYGFKLDFHGVDRSYDRIQNPNERFKAFHDSLEKWLSLSDTERRTCVERSMPNIIHNQELFRQSNYSKESYIRLKEKVESIFKDA